MKKNLALFTIAFIILIISGCAGKTTKPSVNNIDPVNIPSVCTSCDTPKTKRVVCAKETKTIQYIDRCSGSCGFPVTVRKKSNCNKGGI